MVGWEVGGDGVLGDVVRLCVVATTAFESFYDTLLGLSVAFGGRVLSYSLFGNCNKFMTACPSGFFLHYGPALPEHSANGPAIWFSLDARLTTGDVSGALHSEAWERVE